MQKNKKDRNQARGLRDAHTTISKQNIKIRGLKTDNAHLRTMVEASAVAGIKAKEQLAEYVTQDICSAHILSSAVFLIKIGPKGQYTDPDAKDYDSDYAGAVEEVLEKYLQLCAHKGEDDGET